MMPIAQPQNIPAIVGVQSPMADCELLQLLEKSVQCPSIERMSSSEGRYEGRIYCRPGIYDQFLVQIISESGHANFFIYDRVANTAKPIKHVKAKKHQLVVEFNSQSWVFGYAYGFATLNN